jgi:predicted permease
VEPLRDWLHGLRLRLRALTRREDVEAELTEEMEFHLQMETERWMRRGVRPEEARRRARLAFGGVERFKEQTREARGTRHVEVTMQDFKFALRSLRRNAVFSSVAILTLALGIGGVAAIFSVVKGVLLEPLPFQQPDRLALLHTRNVELGLEDHMVSPQDFGDWREMNTTFSSMAAYWPTTGTLTDVGDAAVRVTSVFTTENYFDVLGVPPLLGRTFTPDDGPGSTQVLIIGEGLWRRAFGADPEVVGSTVLLDGSPVEVVGVVAAEHTWPEHGDAWTNMTWPMTIQSRQARWMSAVGRLAPDVTIDESHADLDRVAAELAQLHEGDRGWDASVTSLDDAVVGDTRTALWTLLAATGFILLIACANVANLLLSRAEARAREVAVRAAFGAGRMRIARQLLTESLVLATVGGLVGITLAWLGLKTLLRVAPTSLPRLQEVGLDPTVLTVVAGSTLLTGLLFGLAPVVRILGPTMFGSLREGSRGSSRGARGVRMQNGFVVTQLALAVVLVVGAGLLVKSFNALRSVDAGFESGGLLTFELDVSQGAGPDDQAVLDFYRQVLDRLAELPGVEEVAATSTLPLGEALDYAQEVDLLDQPVDPNREARPYFRHVSPGYFEAMRTPLLAGRPLEPTDREGEAPAIVINETMARLHFAGQDPIGQRLGRLGNRWGPLGVVLFNEAEIVGVVKDIRYDGIRSDAQPAIFLSYLQGPMRRMSILVRTRGTPGATVDAARRVVAEVNPAVPLSDVRALDEVVAGALARDRFSTILLGLFGVVALMLAAVGVYGVLAYAVEQRTNELGIRMALGASAGDVRGMVLREGGLLAALGLGGGAIAALGLAGVLGSQLYGVQPRDPWVFGSVLALLAGVALLASLVPALRATRVDPVTAMRGET